MLAIDHRFADGYGEYNEYTVFMHECEKSMCRVCGRGVCVEFVWSVYY